MAQVKLQGNAGIGLNKEKLRFKHSEESDAEKSFYFKSSLLTVTFFSQVIFPLAKIKSFHWLDLQHYS